MSTKPTVHILATCRKKELLDYTTLVFKTLRTGFPTFDVHVYLNTITEDSVSREVEEIVKAKALEAKCTVSIRNTIHHEWISELISCNNEPFIICDTDMVFWDKMEAVFNNLFQHYECTIAGRYIPSFVDEFSGCLTMPRIHTSLMYINPEMYRKKFQEYYKDVVRTRFTPIKSLIYPSVIPLNGRPTFYDTTALLYQMLGDNGVYRFDPRDLDCYDHFNFGTISDIVLPRLSDGTSWGLLRELCLKDISQLKGCWKQQDKYYASKAPVNPINLTEPQPKKEDPRLPHKVKQDNYAKGQELKEELCLGNKEAEEFCDLWYNYIHYIDDVVDGDETDHIKVPFQAALLYKSAFYCQHKELLFPIVLSVTAQYKLSTMWEEDESWPKQKMSDVLRMAGNQMYGMIALRLGGYEHQNNMLAKIYLADWEGQH